MAEQLTLEDHVRFAVSCGSIDRGVRLNGKAFMPDGYELMQADSGHYYFLRADGEESDIHWNRWAVYRWAKADAAPHHPTTEKGCE